MSGKFEGNGENWSVSLSREQPHEGVTSVIFRCTSNSSYGWRVVEVREGEYTQDRLDELPEKQLRALFERSQPFDYAHDPKAREWSVGEGGATRKPASSPGHSRRMGTGSAGSEAPTTK